MYVSVHQSGCSVITCTFVVGIDIPLDSVTYSYPCKNTCCGRYTPTFDFVSLLALFIIMQKHRCIGNWFWINLNVYPSFSRGRVVVVVIFVFWSKHHVFSYSPFFMQVWHSRQSLYKSIMSHCINHLRGPLFSTTWWAHFLSKQN